MKPKPLRGHMIVRSTSNNFRILGAAALVVAAAAFQSAAATHYVNVSNTTPSAPYTSWVTAATTIQAAVNAAASGEEVLVTNGIYQSGATAVYGMSNRVAVTIPITLRSVNGPQVTSIVGYRVPGLTNGPTAVRCVYLASRAVLSGFTLTNGATQAAGDPDQQESGGGVWCQYTDALVTNCVLVGNSACDKGGGAYGGTLNNCALIGNLAESGGGAASGVLKNCTLSGNSASYGGGASGGTLENCTLGGNWAKRSGGGAYDSTLNNSVLTGNSASAYNGGGADSCVLNSCTLSGNWAKRSGGGASRGRLENCTVTGNLALSGAGGVDSGTLGNCIIYYNAGTAGTVNYAAGTLNYCCTTPLPLMGNGNLEVEPQLASATHLSAASPCRGAGSDFYTTGVDIDGEPWANPPSIGCDEYHPGSSSGSLSVAIVAFYTNVAAGFETPFEAHIGGRASASSWDFGDGTVLSNRPYASHAWAGPGDYVVVLRAFNDTYTAGVSAQALVRVVNPPVHYVSIASTTAREPYTNWATAAPTIQQAVDAGTIPGALVLVSNGVYRSGSMAVYGMSNRVAVTRPVTVRSINGPQVTSIVGYHIPGLTNGPAALRCVYLTNGAVLSGFTLTNGATQANGLGNPKQEAGGGAWCESAAAVITNCVLSGNAARSYGGGAYGGTLKNCTLRGNSAPEGGGSYGGTLTNCTLSGNSASFGGGASSGELDNCTLTGNSASFFDGGGANSSVLKNSTLSGNWAKRSGGGASGARLHNCTVTGNQALLGGGGVDYATVNNCIVYYNTATDSSHNYSLDSSLNYCCTTPLPLAETGNIDVQPQLVDATHLSAGSSCRGAGSPAYTTGVDIDGQPWANPPSIGCDEYHSGSTGDSLSVAIVAVYTNVAAGFEASFEARIGGQATASSWDFGDGTVLSNRPDASHAWAAPGAYAVVLRAFNETYPAGLSTQVVVRVISQPVHYVSVSSATPRAPYTNWATAAVGINLALDAVTVPGALVLVGNGAYQNGGRVVYGMTNRVAVTKPVVVRSLNGPKVTSILGYRVPGPGAVRCVYLTNGAVLSGFTLTNGATQTAGDMYKQGSGGGVWCESKAAVATNCVLAGNSANYYGGGAYSGTLNNCTLSGNSAKYGGGSYAGMLNNCTLSGNSASNYAAVPEGGGGGGVYSGTLNNCTLKANSAGYGGGVAGFSTLNNCILSGNWAYNEGGGGAYNSTLNNCIVYYNSAPAAPNYWGSDFNYCCTIPLPPGPGNIDSAPLFMDTNGWSNLRLQSNSPCINAGANAYAPGAVDLDGNPRIVGGIVDMGAYDFQAPASRLPYAWLQAYGLSTDGSADFTDPDRDGLNNWQEWVAGTDPTNAASALRMLVPTNASGGLVLRWTSVANRTYFLQRAPSLAGLSLFEVLRSNLAGSNGITSFTDTNAAGSGPWFYRVGVQQ